MIFALFVASQCAHMAIPAHFVKEVTSEGFFNFFKQIIIPPKLVPTKIVNEEKEEGFEWKKDFEFKKVKAQVDVKFDYPWLNSNGNVDEIKKFYRLPYNEVTKSLAKSLSEFRKLVMKAQSPENIKIPKPIIHGFKTPEFVYIYKAFQAWKAQQKK